MISIESAVGGWILHFDEEEQEEGYKMTPLPEVFGYDVESEENHLLELRAARNLLYRVAEEIGIIYSKHARYNIRIEIEDIQGAEDTI